MKTRIWRNLAIVARQLSLPSGTGARIVLVAGAVMLGALAAIAMTVLNLRRDTLDESRMGVHNIATMVTRQTSRAIRAVDLELQDLQDLAARLGANTPDRFAEILGSDTIEARLRGDTDRLRLTRSLALIGADGRLVNYSGDRSMRGLDLSDREYFQHFTEHDDGGLYIALPVANRVDGTWTIFMARRIASPGGRLAGLVLGGVPAAYFADVFNSLVLPQAGTFRLMRRDSVVLMRMPAMTERIGDRQGETSPWFAAVAAGGGSYDSTGPIARIVTVQPLPDYPLVVSISAGRAAVLAHWRDQAIAIAGGAVLLFGVCAALVRLLLRMVARLENSRTSLLFKNAELTRTSDRLNLSQIRLQIQTQVLHTTLETMDQGLMMIDAEARVALCNHQAMEMLDLPATLMASRPTLQEVLAYQHGQGEFIGPVPHLRHAIEVSPMIDLPTYERRRPNGRVIEVRSARLANGGIVRTFTDITARRAAEDRIRHNAHHDALTQLCNRVMFGEQLQAALLAAGQAQHSMAVLYLDLDHFKQVNDALGHAAGDLLLAEVARRMRASVRDTDTVARMGGDEFAIIQPDADRPDSTMALARRLLERVSAPYDLEGTTAVIGMSIGIAWYPEDGLEAEDLLRHADAALYAAKRGGRNAVRCYSPSLSATS